MAKKKWIQGAIKKKGALTKTAKRKGLVKKGETLSKTDLEKLSKSKSGVTRKRAALAKTLRKMSKKKK